MPEAAQNFEGDIHGTAGGNGVDDNGALSLTVDAVTTMGLGDDVKVFEDFGALDVQPQLQPPSQPQPQEVHVQVQVPKEEMQADKDGDVRGIRSVVSIQSSLTRSKPPPLK